MDWKKTLIEIAALVSVIVVSVFIWECFLDSDADRRFVLYNIRQELKKEMSRYEIEAVISRHNAPYIHRRFDNENETTLVVYLDSINYLSLTMHFENAKLTRANFAGEDNPFDVPKDAPSNLE